MAEPVTILNVDDTEAGRYAKSRVLKRAGYEVAEAATGGDALRLVEELRPPLVLLDIKLPDMSGLEVCAIIKRQHPEIIVLQISASFVAGDDRVRGLESGADGYLTQPVEPRELAASVHSLLRIRQAETAVRESEARFRNMADHAPVMMWVTDQNGFCTYLNSRWYEFTGQTEAEALGLGWTDATHPDDKQRAADTFLRANAARAPFYVEYRLRRADGAYRWAIDAASPRFGTNREFLGYVGSVIDISGRKEAELALAASEDRLRLANEAAGIGTWDFDLLSGELRWDDRTRELFGLGPDAGVDYDVFLAGLHPEDREGSNAAFQGALVQGGPGAFDMQYRTVSPGDGTERWIQAAGRTVFESERAVRVVGTALDITGRRRMESALRASEARLRAILEAAPVGIVIAEAPNGRIIEGNAQAERIFGHEVLSSPDMDSYKEYVSFHADGRQVEGSEYPLSRAIRGEDERPEMEVLYRRGDGRDAWVRLIAAPIRDEAGEISGGVVASLDIDSEKRAEAALLELNATLEAQVEERTRERDRLWELSEDLLVTADYEGRLLRVSPSWMRTLGYSEEALLTIHYADLIHPDDQGGVFESLGRMRDTARTIRFDNRIRAADGTFRWISWILAPEPGGERMGGVGRDVTAEKEAAEALAEAEERLRQAQKMEAVGQLTGGVAHDFNNLLTIVIGGLETIQRIAPEENGRLKRAADNAMRGATRAATLTQRLLAFSRRQPLAPKTTDVNRLVADMSDLLHRTLGETIELETVQSGGLWRVEVDPNQLENALLNLAVNARDAMPDGGKLTIETANTHLDANYSLTHSEVAPGQYVVICTTDRGEGMSREVVERVFEPFFTTKEVGRGTGLGLSQVYGFVKQSGGHVKIYSEVGQGTTVKIYLPRLVGAATEDKGEIKEAVPEGTTEETVLVVEDDDDVRTYSVEVLRELGYRVLEAHDGPSALRLLDRQDRVDLLFSDVVLPGGMNGERLAATARDLRPGLKVLFTTGYARNAIVHQGRLDPGVQLITKPFTYAELAAKIRDVIDMA